MKRILLPVVLFFFVLTSCNKAPVFDEGHIFGEDIWNRFDKISFKVPVKHKDGYYDIYFIVKHTAALTEDRLPVYFIMNTPSGEERMKEVKLKVRDNQAYNGENAEGTYTLKTLLWQGVSIPETGTMTVEVENIFPKIQVDGLKEIRLVVEKTGKPQEEEK